MDVLIVLLFVRSTCTFQASRASGTAEKCEIMAEDKIGQVRGSWDKVICGAIRMFLLFFFPPSSSRQSPDPVII